MTNAESLRTTNGPPTETFFSPRWSRGVFWGALLLVVTAGLARSWIATRTDGLQIDEAWHTVAGVSYARTGDFRLNPEHPPLVKLWVGLNLPESVFKLPAFRPLDDKSDERKFIDDAFYLDNDPDEVQRHMRLAMLGFHGLLLLAFALSMERVFGSLVALLTVAVLLIDPTVAAHLPVVLTDLPLSLLSAVAMLWAYVAFRTWRAKDLLLAAATLGLAIASKHSGVAVALAVPLLGVALAFVGRDSAATGELTRRFLGIGSVLLGAYITLWACYGFRFSEHPSTAPAFGASARHVAQPRAQLDAPLLFNRAYEDKVADLESPRHRAVLTLAHDLHLLPRAYLWGLADIVRVGVEGRDEVNYVFGHRIIRITPWYFFPAVLLVKFPLGMLWLILAGGLLVIRKRVPQAWIMPTASLLAWALVFMLVIMRGNSGYAGIRHVLPVFPVVALLAALTLTMALQTRSQSLRASTGVAFCAALLSALPIMRPWEYYNELVRGASGAWQSFNDDGLDNGQRSKDLVDYYNKHVRDSGDLVYDFYGLYENQEKAYHVTVQSLDRDPGDADTITGTVFVNTRSLPQRPVYDFEVFRNATPVYRIGNLLVYRGTFQIPWLRAIRRRARVEHALAAEHRDPALAEQLLREIITIYPQDYQSSFELGNMLVERGETESAIQAYTLSRKYVPPENGMTEGLTGQIEALGRLAQNNTGATRVQPLRNPWLE